MSKRITTMAVAMAFSLVAVPAFAAGQFSWLKNSPVSHFTDEDWDLLRSTARDLLDNGEDGDKAEWANSESGAEGSVEVLNSYEEDGRTCRRAKFYNSARGLAGTGVYRLCRVEDGSWKIAP